MALPNRAEAIVDIQKLRDYCLNPYHPEGRHKARLFRALLHLGQEDAEWLRVALLRAALAEEVTVGNLDEFGQRYMLDSAIEHMGYHAVVRSAWIVLSGDRVPRLTTCYLVREGG